MLTARPLLRVAALARAAGLLVLAAPAVWSPQRPEVPGLLALALVWTLATVADLHVDRLRWLVTVLEALTVGAVCVAGLDTSAGILVALVLPPFTAGLLCGPRGVVAALVAQTLGLVAALELLDRSLTTAQGYGVFSWSCTGLGLGLIGAFLHGELPQQIDAMAPYRHAQALLRRLISISGGLETGLDPMALAGSILAEVCDELPVAATALYVPRGEDLTPLVTRSLVAPAPEDRPAWDAVAGEAWRAQGVVKAGARFAFPLSTGSAIVAATLSERVDHVGLGVDERIRRLRRRLRERAIPLDTALLFAAFRDAATRDERRRLAREMHDGVAQDIASLGYLVDGLAETTDDPAQCERIAMLRDRISAIVGEVRRALVTLRTNVGANESLGAAISSIARHLSESSGVPIHVTLEERTERLLPEIEGELFRIAQEAMTNAVRHADATAIEVTCRVRAPAVRITVADDGRGMQAPRADSQGLSIMRERARLVNAVLEIGDTPGGGLTVSVVIDGDDVVAPARTEIGART